MIIPYVELQLGPSTKNSGQKGETSIRCRVLNNLTSNWLVVIPQRGTSPGVLKGFEVWQNRHSMQYFLTQKKEAWVLHVEELVCRCDICLQLRAEASPRAFTGGFSSTSSPQLQSGAPTRFFWAEFGS